MIMVLTSMFIAVGESRPETSYIKMVEIWLIFNLLIPFLDVLLHCKIDNLRSFKLLELFYYSSNKLLNILFKIWFLPMRLYRMQLWRTTTTIWTRIWTSRKPNWRTICSLPIMWTPPWFSGLSSATGSLACSTTTWLGLELSWPSW